ncbi:MAG: DUF2721 domain-containing protein [Proteobacteria bacterium]|nr:DUF2721 domain-containing protein [Pseudomonadota bacterium]
MLNVMVQRLARVIDRARVLEERWTAMSTSVHDEARTELDDLETRRKLASWAINFAAASALCVCIVIILLFIDEFTAYNLRMATGLAFVLSMVALVGGVSSFLREVYLATHSSAIDLQRLERRRDATR